MDTRLLCTFTTKEELSTTLQSIRESYHLVYNYIYVLQNGDNPDELFVTYNVAVNVSRRKGLRNTILVHRKRETNTLYTINALNELIKMKNDGVMDDSFVINWEDYKNSIILTDVGGTKQIATEIYDVIKFDES